MTLLRDIVILYSVFCRKIAILVGKVADNLNLFNIVFQLALQRRTLCGISSGSSLFAKECIYESLVYKVFISPGHGTKMWLL